MRSSAGCRGGCAPWRVAGACPPQGPGTGHRSPSIAGPGPRGAAREVTGQRANLVWVPPEVIEAAGIEPWTELPVWVPPTGEYAGLHNGDVSAAYAAGLRCRPVAQTIADTWRWLQAEGYPPERPGRPANG